MKCRPSWLGCFRDLLVGLERLTVVVDQPFRGDASAPLDLLLHPGHEPVGLSPAGPQRPAGHLKISRGRVRKAEAVAGPLLETAPCQPGRFLRTEAG